MRISNSSSDYTSLLSGLSSVSAQKKTKQSTAADGLADLTAASSTTDTKTLTSDAVLKDLLNYIQSKTADKDESKKKTADELLKELSDYLKSSDTTKADKVQSTDSFLQQYYMMQQMQTGSATAVGTGSSDLSDSDGFSALNQKYAAAITSYDNNSKFID